MLECIVEINKINRFFDKMNIAHHECFSNEETWYLFEKYLRLIEDYVGENILYLREPDFHEELLSSLHKLNTIEFENIMNDQFFEELFEILDEAHEYYFTYFMPRRSHSSSFIRRTPNTEKIAKRIQELRDRPQPEQRTNEWYLFRYNLLTASNAWKAFESQSIKNSLIYEKCSPLNLDKYGTVNMNSAFHWGHKYEPLSVMMYEEKYKTKVEDFGCIPHAKYEYIGASPDGINVDPTSERYGRMLEIKNIVNREIDGIPKKEYWVQMQMQMNVCELNECDFLETKFEEYADEDAFMADGTFQETKCGEKKGIIMCFICDGLPKYEYCPLGVSKEEYESWSKEMFGNYDSWLMNIYWKLPIFSCVLVLRNYQWFDAALPELERCWEIIEYERENGYEHRAPKKRSPKVEITEKKRGVCLIDLKNIV